MSIETVFQLFEANRNDEEAIKMAAYMKNNFLFLGINSPKRKLLQRDFLREKQRSKIIDWEFVFQCFKMPEREYQYLALDYLIALKKHVKMVDIEHIEKLIQTKSWWDSVDGLDQVVGALILKFPETKENYIKKWMKSDNIWLVRVAINFQLEYKHQTDSSLLSEVILANAGSKEFFVNKAAGWSLREYSKWNKDWVQNFIETHKSILNKLTIREASKYLG
jgi:3-methyladenine DNA glycosylase AlkD